MNQTMIANRSLLQMDQANFSIKIFASFSNVSGSGSTLSVMHAMGGGCFSPMIVALLLTCCLIAIGFYTSRRNLAKGSNCGAAKVFADVSSCERILTAEGRVFDNGDRKANKLSRTESRARPNERLKFAFGIDNGFTTINDKSRKTFKSNATQHLKNFDKNWGSAGDSARSFIKHTLDKAKQVDIVPVIQVLTLRLSLQAVHNVNLDTVDNSKVLFVAEDINRLWISSKKKSTIEPWSTQVKLHKALHALCPDSDCAKPDQNPLNLILPSYETLWRIVLRCLIEVVFRHYPDPRRDCGNLLSPNDLWRARLHKFLETPTEPNLKDRSEFGSALDVVKEALRLYPPTRRVYREFQYDDGTETEVVAADIEALQREYPEDVKRSDEVRPVFDPKRWITHENALDARFFPFGRGAFLCPAEARFAYWAIAILVGALSVEVGNDQWKLDPDPLADEAGDQPLITDREAYADLALKRI